MVTSPSAETPDTDDGVVSSVGTSPPGSRRLGQDDTGCSTAEGKLNTIYYTQLEQLYVAFVWYL